MDLDVISVSLIIGIASAILGVFIVLRRLALVSDVLSHVALPGMALSLFFGINVFFGAFAALAFAVLGIFILENKSKISIEAIVGIMFTTSLALGMIFFPDKEDLLDGLFGNIESITIFDTWLTYILGGAVIVLTLIFFKSFAHTTFSKELAQSEGFSVNKVNLSFLFLLAVVISLGIKVVGTLLVGALTILPVSIAKNLSSSLRGMTIASILFSIVIVLLGVLFYYIFSVPLGASIILSGSVLFLVSLFFKK